MVEEGEFCELPTIPQRALHPSVYPRPASFRPRQGGVICLWVNPLAQCHKFRICPEGNCTPNVVSHLGQRRIVWPVSVEPCGPEYRGTWNRGCLMPFRFHARRYVRVSIRSPTPRQPRFCGVHRAAAANWMNCWRRLEPPRAPVLPPAGGFCMCGW